MSLRPYAKGIGELRLDSENTIKDQQRDTERDH